MLGENMFKDRIKSLRKEYGLTQRDLGIILSVTQRSISRMETGETFPSEDVLNKIADFFNVSTDYLLCRTELKKYTIKHKKK